MVKNADIKEKKLVKYKERINYLLLLNGIKFDYDYKCEKDPELNSSISYDCVINNRVRGGFFCYDRDTKKFIGAVLKTEVEEYLVKEGFSEEQAHNEPTWMQVSSPEDFVTLLAYPFHQNLKFE